VKIGNKIMKVTGLDGKQHTMYLVGYKPKLSDERARSELHLQIREILKRLYPSARLLEEVPLPGSDGLFADFFLPQLGLVVEAHGRQHYEFVKHFHGDMMGFMESKKRDSKKKQWCELNNFRFVECSYKGKEDEWEKAILG
jgi:hypothetical protein